MLIFSEKKSEVDDIHEYLLLKGVEAVAIHGGKGRHYIRREGWVYTEVLHIRGGRTRLNIHD